MNLQDNRAMTCLSPRAPPNPRMQLRRREEVEEVMIVWLGGSMNRQGSHWLAAVTPAADPRSR